MPCTLIEAFRPDSIRGRASSLLTIPASERMGIEPENFRITSYKEEITMEESNQETEKEIQKEMEKEMEKKVTNWVTVAITVLISVAIMLVISLILFKLVWAWVVPDLFPERSIRV